MNATFTGSKPMNVSSWHCFTCNKKGHGKKQCKQWLDTLTAADKKLCLAWRTDRGLSVV